MLKLKLFKNNMSSFVPQAKDELVCGKKTRSTCSIYLKTKINKAHNIFIMGFACIVPPSYYGVENQTDFFRQYKIKLN